MIVVVLTCAAMVAAQQVEIGPTAETSSAPTSWTLVQSSGSVPTSWINPRTASGGENLSAAISAGPRYAISLAERKGRDGLIIVASAPTWGEMYFGSRGGFVRGFTVVDEPLVVVTTPLRTELWRRGDEYHLRKWYSVRKALRCGNEFRAIAMREVALTVPTPCPPEKEIERQFDQRIEYIDRLIYRQVEVPDVNITINRPPELVITIPNPVVQMVINFVLPPPAQPIGFVPVHSGGQVNAVPRRLSVERRLAGVSVAFVPQTKINNNNNVSATGGSATATGGAGGAGGNASASATASAEASATQSQTCPTQPAQPEPCPPLEEAGVPTQVDPVTGDVHPQAPTPAQAGG